MSLSGISIAFTDLREDNKSLSTMSMMWTRMDSRESIPFIRIKRHLSHPSLGCQNSSWDLSRVRLACLGLTTHQGI